MDTVDKYCGTCFWLKDFKSDSELPISCDSCMYESSPENPYPRWMGSTSKNVEKDMVNSPPHYKAHPSGVECIQITEHMNFCLGNAMKYIWRAGEKHESPLEDLNKAKWYIEREIERLKNAE